MGHQRQPWAARPTDPVLRQRADAEVALIRRVTNDLARRVALVPFQVGDASGPAGLRELAGLEPVPCSRGSPVAGNGCRTEAGVTCASG